MKTLKLLFFLLFGIGLTAQETIELRNPSFEDFPRAMNAPRGWYPCGDENLNTPDVQPGSFGVTLPALDGYTYLGMVTRDNDTWEAVVSRLASPLQKDKKYWCSVFLAQSQDLNSFSRTLKKEVKFNKPVKLRIWGGDGFCQKSELLGESELIDHEIWKDYEFVFEPRMDHKFLTFEAFYETPTLVPYNGNLLLDHCSDIIEITGNEDFDAEKFLRNKKLTNINYEETVNIQKAKKKYPIAKKSLPEVEKKEIETVKKAFNMAQIKDRISSGDTVTNQEIQLVITQQFENQGIQYDSTKTTGLHSQILFHAWELENKTLKMGLRNFMFNTSNDYALEIAKNLQSLDFNTSASVIEKAVDIISKHAKGEELKDEDYQYFRNSDQLLEQSFQEEKAQNKIPAYLEEHKKAILQELQKHLK